MPGGWWCCCGGCTDCESCCSDGLPNSIDVTFGSGWTEPTVDSGKMGCADPHTDLCQDGLDAQTFNLIPYFQPACGNRYPTVDCMYKYCDTGFCQTETDVCDDPDPIAYMVLHAWFECTGGKCKLKVEMIICGECDIVTYGWTQYDWESAEFAPQVCAEDSWPLVYQGMTQGGSGVEGDPEGMCVPPSTVANRDVTAEDGG